MIKKKINKGDIFSLDLDIKYEQELNNVFSCKQIYLPDLF